MHRLFIVFRCTVALQVGATRIRAILHTHVHNMCRKISNHQWQWIICSFNLWLNPSFSLRQDGPGAECLKKSRSWSSRFRENQELLLWDQEIFKILSEKKKEAFLFYCFERLQSSTIFYLHIYLWLITTLLSACLPYFESPLPVNERDRVCRTWQQARKNTNS